METTSPLTGQTALVCGSTQGIGQAIAAQLARMGASVVLMARNAQALEAVRAELPQLPGQTHQMLTADFADPATVDAAVRGWLAAHEGPIHILINNTGGPPGGPILDASVDDFFSAYRMHLACSHLLVQALAPGMRDARYGRIVNIISTSVRIPISGLGVSNTTRGAMASWAKTLANELAPWGITVNSILPGFTRTERLQSLIRSRAAASGRSEAQIEEEMQRSIPAGRFGSAAEIAEAACFLASPAASYITGVSLPVDGGRTGSI
ncbi:MAG: SDR family oxidoreductase [Bacteroidia bacterium]|nr:SDR family oxidoreductase [Bacteroidia bacterium]